VVIQATSLEADHTQPGGVVTLNVPEPPTEEKDDDGGETVFVQVIPD
jgi:hypothetical protein